jgi:hypothetical protein
MARKNRSKNKLIFKHGLISINHVGYLMFLEADVKTYIFAIYGISEDQEFSWGKICPTHEADNQPHRHL